MALAAAVVAIAGAGGAVARVGAASAGTTSVANAYSFLDQMMDRYATGTTPRLVQSYTGGTLGADGFTNAYSYDVALVIDAYLAEGTPDGLVRAETLGSSLLLVQAHDPAHDGRVRAAYAPNPLVVARPAGHHPRVAVHIRDRTADVGTMAWIGLALTRLYLASGDSTYLAGAQAIGTWVERNCADQRGAGGFTGGRSGRGARIRWKSTEHNIDLYALFTMLDTVTGDASWGTAAAAAHGFVQSMWDPSSGSFFVGTTTDGVTVNTSEQPEDVNSWSYLALADPAYASSVDWDVNNLAVSSGGSSGVSFCLGDKSGVWFEGTAHLADALEVRNRSGDASMANQLLADIQTAQASAPNNDGLGIVAASKDMLSDCDGDFYYASLHTGATSWYVLAVQGVDPLVL